MYSEMKKMFAGAEREKKAVLAFNFSTLEMAKAIVQAADKVGKDFILQTSERDANFFGTNFAVAVSEELRKNSRQSFFLHFDHGKSFDSVKQAILAGYDSVHFDGSELEFEKNSRITKKIVNFAHRKGVWVEAELGKVIGSSVIHRESMKQALKKIELVNPLQAKEFVERTGIDALAAGVGTMHGIWAREERIDFERIKKTKSLARLPLVLHGSTSISAGHLKKAVACGIRKINVSTVLRQGYSNALRKELCRSNEIVPAEYLPKAIGEVKKEAQKRLEWSFIK